MSFDPYAEPPLLTSHLPGIGGKIKTQLTDFEVEEIPAYEPSGEGQFLYLWIEKIDMGAEYFARAASRRLGIPVSELGMAGLKDRRAVTRQWISVPANCEARLKDLDGDGIRVLKTSLHANKLRPGHLKGNRFKVLIRETAVEAKDRLPGLLSLLKELGVPNYYGPQRFGINHETLKLGLGLLWGEEKRAVRSPFLRKLALSAGQSALFNHYLAKRYGDGVLHRVLPGDVMAKWPAGGMFTVEDVGTEQTRFENREIVPAGPMFGRKMLAAKDEAGLLEAKVLSDANLRLESFMGFGKLVQGTRRRVLVYLESIEVNWTESGPQLAFQLPAGSYATVVLQHLMQTPVAAEDGDSAEDQ